MLPPVPLLSGSYENSFAYSTIKDRLPNILTKVIDSLARCEQRLTDIEKSKLINLISGLKYEITRNKSLKLTMDCRPGSSECNESSMEELEQLRLQDDIERGWKCEIDSLNEAGKGSWFAAPWLFVECLMYRHLQSFTKSAIIASAAIFIDSPYDLFEHLKMESLFDNLPAIASIGLGFEKIIHAEDKDYALLKLLELSLWGNRADLSLSFDGHDHKSENSNKMIVVNDTDRVLPLIKGSKRITIILDNSGLEHFSDLCLADYFVTNFDISVVFECKQYPWFVSDVVVEDFSRLFKALSTYSDNTKRLADRWISFLASSKWVLHDNPFWTTSHPYWRLPEHSVFKSLCESDFLIFKGDLNYRKMVYDAKWPTTTAFSEAIGPLKGSALPPFLMIRTNKSDVCVGLSDVNQEESLNMMNQSWMVSGKFGVMQAYVGE